MFLRSLLTLVGWDSKCWYYNQYSAWALVSSHASPLWGMEVLSAERPRAVQSRVRYNPRARNELPGWCWLPFCAERCFGGRQTWSSVLPAPLGSCRPWVSNSSLELQGLPLPSGGEHAPRAVCHPAGRSSAGPTQLVREWGAVCSPQYPGPPLQDIVKGCSPTGESDRD